LKVALFDFQKDALHQLREKISSARTFASSTNPQAIAFSAPTGSGKTIMMTALFEAILDGPDDQLEWPLNWKPQRDAVILWLSDMPELNEQTRLKIESQSDRIYRVNQLISIDGDYDSERLAGGCVYFINTQKLGSDKKLTKVGDGRRYSIWETLTNTALSCPDRFYVVIDEAHRGMATGNGATEALSIMQRFVLGHSQVGLVHMPLVIGVSATPKRFTDLLENAPHDLKKVIVPADEVRASGLLKDRILIHHPETVPVAEMTLLEEAARNWAKLTQSWGRYCAQENEQRVWPILVVQVENGAVSKTDKNFSPTKTNLVDALSVIEGAIGRRLNPDEVVHALHDAPDMDIGGRKVRKIEASKINADKDIGVVFFKTSLSTGWDCPRAEVMMSFRRAEDHTYIAQLLGRMVRTPLARRIERDAALNDVHLFLPYFDTKAVAAVVSSLNNVEEVPPSETGSDRELVILTKRPNTELIFGVLDELVTYRVNASRVQSNLRRFMVISRSLTLDNIDPEAWDAAKHRIVGWMEQEISTLKKNGKFAIAENSITTLAMKQLAVEYGTKNTQAEASYRIFAAEIDVERLFENAGRVLSHGLHMTYWQAHAEREAMEVKREAVILSKDHAAMTAIEAAAGEAFDGLYDKHKKRFNQLTEQRRAAYEKLRISTAKPTEIDWVLPPTIDFRRPANSPIWERHLYLEETGEFRATLGTWEEAVLQEELADESVIGWLRNVDRKAWSLEIPYNTGGEIRPMYPDLVIVRALEDEMFSVDILEPHNPNLGDNFEKAVGLARFAEQHGHLFGRIQMIRKKTSPAGGEKFVRLEINKEINRKHLLLINNNPQLDDIFEKFAEN
jgi:type III restriction enzyme